MNLTIRPATRADLDELAPLRQALWPDGSIEEHTGELVRVLDGTLSSLPYVALVAEVGERIVGFVEVGLRSHADGCDPARAVGFIEGWYVVDSQRRQGIGCALIDVAEDWARDHGCAEVASDALADNVPSQQAHEAFGYEIVDRCVHYRKML